MNPRDEGYSSRVVYTSLRWVMRCSMISAYANVDNSYTSISKYLLSSQSPADRACFCPWLTRTYVRFSGACVGGFTAYHQSQHKFHIGIRISSWASSKKPGGGFTEREGHIIDLRSVWHGCRRNELEQKPWYFGKALVKR